MSVSQIKKQFEEFSAYLGRDIVGQGKLKKLKDETNELRTQLASAQVRATDATDLLAACTARAQAAEGKLVDAQHEIQRLQQLAQNLSRDLTRATDHITSAAAETTDSESESAPSTISEREIRSVIKRLRKVSHYCPRMSGASSLEVRVWNRNSIAQGWSQEALWTLGATVAVLAAYEGTVAVQAGELFRDANWANPEGTTTRHLVQWFFKYNVEDPNKNTTRAGPVRLTNYKPPL